MPNLMRIRSNPIEKPMHPQIYAIKTRTSPDAYYAWQDNLSLAQLLPRLSQQSRATRPAGQRSPASVCSKQAPVPFPTSFARQLNVQREYFACALQLLLTPLHLGHLGHVVHQGIFCGRPTTMRVPQEAALHSIRTRRRASPFWPHIINFSHASNNFELIIFSGFASTARTKLQPPRGERGWGDVAQPQRCVMWYK